MLHIHVLEKNVFSIQKGSAVCVCVCACVDMHAHTHTQTPISIPLRSNLLSSDLLYIFWFVSARFFFKSLIEVVKISMIVGYSVALTFLYFAFYILRLLRPY